MEEIKNIRTTLAELNDIFRKRQEELRRREEFLAWLDKEIKDMKSKRSH